MKSFVRKVRSKSPFRRRRRAEALITEVREKERSFMKQLGSSADQTSLPDETAEIEVVLESSPDFDSNNGNIGRPKCQPDSPGRLEMSQERKEIERFPDLATSSSVSTEEPTNVQEASRRFMEKQQQIAAKNRRKSFRDRFMRPSKSSISTPPSPSNLPSGTKQLGISVKGSKSFTSPTDSTTKPTERGRTRDRSMRCTNSKRSSRKSAISKSTPENGPVDPLLDSASRGEQSHARDRTLYLQSNTIPVQKPVSIELGVQSRVSELSSPAAIIRQESLGTQSIQGVRHALQKMELELAAAGEAGRRVPREKIMNALNFMAHALHHQDQKDALAKELDAWIDESVIAGHPGRRVDRDDSYDDDDDDDVSEDNSASYSDDDYSSTFDFDAFDDAGSSNSSYRQRRNEIPFQDLFARLGKFFTISDEDKTAVRHALDDLLWTETIGSNGSPQCLIENNEFLEDATVSFGDIPSFDPISCSMQDPSKEPRAPKRGRSWWRNQSASGRKKENRYPKERGIHVSSVGSKMSLPSPTGRVNPRGPARDRRMSGTTSTIPRIRPPPQPVAIKERTRTPRFPFDESDSFAWNSSAFTSFEDGSDFTRQGDRYTIPSNAKSTSRQASYASHYKMSQPSFKPEYDRFESDFLQSPREEDEFEDWDDCLHPAENLSIRRQAV